MVVRFILVPPHWISFRLPPDLHARLKDAAAEERRSMANLLAVIVEQALDARDKKESA
jgi:predicted DNA-binding protein